MKTKLFTLALAALTIGLLGSCCKKEEPKMSVTGVTLDKNSLEITVGDPDVKLTATIAPENATDKTVSWSSDKTEFATVDNQGNVHAVAPGTATITVTTADGNKTATCVVTVKSAKVPVTGVTLDKTTLEITVGDPDVKLAATVLPENATDKTVSWSSDKTEFATVDNQGNVHAVAPGTANITVTTTDGNKTATCAVTVKAALPEGALSGEFSVSAAKKVHFSQGNLVATIDATGAPTAWKFSAHQYEYIGANVANTKIGKEAGDVDFFGWSTDAASNNWGIHTKTSATKNFTTGNFKDWGKAVGDGDTWRTLSKAEWTYLVNKDDNDNIRKGKYKYGVTVCEKASCLILAPDDFEGTIAESYDAAAWASAEAAGLVCLPAAGDRIGSGVGSYGTYGFYWSSSKSGDEEEAYDLRFTGSEVNPGGRREKRYIGCSVRLVTEVK